MKNSAKKTAKKPDQFNTIAENERIQQNESAISKPRSPGMFITNDLNKLSELPNSDQILNRKSLSKTTTSTEHNPKFDAILTNNSTLRRTSNSNIQRIEPKYTVTRTPSNMSLNLNQNLNANLSLNMMPKQMSNAITSSTDSRPVSSSAQVRAEVQEEDSNPLQTNASQNSLRLPGIIEIASEREANIRLYEIEQFRSDEMDLKEQFSDLLGKMSTLQRTLADLEGRELEEVQQKRHEAESFERETREKIEQLQVRKEEIDREASRLDNRVKELKSLQRETEMSRTLNNKMRNEMGKCLRKLGKQYENGCRKYIKELESMENEANDRRVRDRDLMDQYKQKQSELAILLEEKMILRKSLEERNQLEKLLGQNGISLLVASNQSEPSVVVGQTSSTAQQEEVEA